MKKISIDEIKLNIKNFIENSQPVVIKVTPELLKYDKFKLYTKRIFKFLESLK